eukprot:8360671-Alexandrium_andersonii.AAC.1
MTDPLCLALIQVCTQSRKAEATQVAAGSARGRTMASTVVVHRAGPARWEQSTAEALMRFKVEGGRPCAEA